MLIRTSIGVLITIALSLSYHQFTQSPVNIQTFSDEKIYSNKTLIQASNPNPLLIPVEKILNDHQSSILKTNVQDEGFDHSLDHLFNSKINNEISKEKKHLESGNIVNGGKQEIRQNIPIQKTKNITPKPSKNPKIVEKTADQKLDELIQNYVSATYSFRKLSQVT